MDKELSGVVDAQISVHIGRILFVGRLGLMFVVQLFFCWLKALVRCVETSAEEKHRKVAETNQGKTFKYTCILISCTGLPNVDLKKVSLKDKVFWGSYKTPRGPN